MLAFLILLEPQKGPSWRRCPARLGSALMGAFSSLTAAVMVLPCTQLASAQSAPEQMYQPYGIEGQSYADPFYAPARDEAGVRLVVNGRPVDLRDRTGGYAAPFFSSRQGQGGSVMAGPTLRGPTLSAAAIGNNISVSNVSNSTIIVTATNTGNQIATAQGRR